MMESLFNTFVSKQKLVTSRSRLSNDILEECYQMRDFDDEGRAWSEEHYPNGFTSYATRNDLNYMSSTFRALEEKIRPCAYEYAKNLGYDMRGLSLRMTDMWLNIMGPGCVHSGHLHPLAFISGTYYVKVPKGASAIRFEDPRLPSFMACPPKKERISKEKQIFVSYTPTPGSLVLFESWLRHEVPAHTSQEERISVSFNYGWEHTE